jgi:AbrB family looped-hinge helix DNA binding protein
MQVSTENNVIIPENQKFGISGGIMTTLQIRGKGTITLPASLRKKYNLEEGEVLTVIDLGGGSILLRPMVSQIDTLSRRAAKTLKEDNVTLDEILETLDEERKKYFNEKYGKKD